MRFEYLAGIVSLCVKGSRVFVFFVRQKLLIAMKSRYFFAFAFYLLQKTCRGQLRVPPKVEGPPKLLDSFLPASMQIMAHLTELMKYDVKPNPTVPWTTTQRPTSSHKPAIYAPEVPPGPEAYFSKGSTYEEYVKRLQNPAGYNYFDRYVFPIEDRSSNGRSLEDQNVLYFGRNFAKLYDLANTLEDNFAPKDIDVQVQQFSESYDDSDFRFELLRQKKVPPTKAYVTLLSLYDLLNKESKRLGLNKFQGYADRILAELVESSTGTSAHQLRFVLNRIALRQDTKRPEILTKIKALVDDLDKDNSYINDALRYIPPLAFVL